MAQSPSWLLCIYTGVSDGISECVTMSLELHAHRASATTLWRREWNVEERDPLSEQLLSKVLYLPPEPFYLPDKKQYTKQRFPASFLPSPYCRARRGRGSHEDLPPPVSPDGSSVDSMRFALCHVCACVCTCLWKLWSMALP